MRLTGHQATQRTRKAWVTRRRNNPSVWTRPTGHQIKLEGFNAKQRSQIRPVLDQINYAHPRSDLHLRSIRLARRGELERTYRKHYPSLTKPNVGGLTRTPRLFGRSTIDLNPKVFSKRSKWDAQGLLTHELGHALHESSNRSRGYRKAFEKDFAAFKRGSQTRAQKSPEEHFAETFRAYHGFPMTKKEHRYFQHTIDNAHIRHIQRYYT